MKIHEDYRAAMRERIKARNKLEAQAPALLAALRAVLPYAEAMAKAMSGQTDTQANKVITAEALNQCNAARAAIAAATNGEGSV